MLLALFMLPKLFGGSGGGGSDGVSDLVGGMLTGGSGNAPAGFIFSNDDTNTGEFFSSSEGKIDTAVAEGSREKRTKIFGDNKDTVTLMVYMCGTDLESKHGMASSDMAEMAAAKYGDNVNIIVYTGGCNGWMTKGISSSVNQIYQIKDGGLKQLVADDGKQAMTDPNTLTGFIKFCTKNFPANRNELILWDHGGGSVSGFGYDEKKGNGSMDLANISKALKNSGTTFDFIGFDACLMATAETALMLDDYADYLIASEETEPGVGWYYTNWVTQLGSDTSTPTVQLGKCIVDDFVSTCDKKCRGQKTTLSVIDLAEFSHTVPDKLGKFAESVSGLIEKKEFKKLSDARYASREFAQKSAIDQVDLVDLAENMATQEGAELASAIRSAVKYNRTSRNMSDAHGVSIYFPYNRTSYVDPACNTYSQIGISDAYSKCIKQFAKLETSGQIAAGGTASPLGSLFSLSGSGSTCSSGNSDVIGSLLGAFLGGGRSVKIDGLNSSNTEFMSEKSIKTDDTADFLALNYFDISNLVWTQNGNEYKMDLPENQWELVHKLDLNMFYDDGGPDADGADGFEATITFAPLDAGAVIKLIDKGILFAATAHLYIYEGGAVDDSKLIADIKGTTAKFDDPIVSNSPDGKITIKYVGKGAYTRPNFAIEVQGYLKQAFEVKSYTVADVSPTNVMAGQQDVQMLHVAMTVVGDYVPLDVQQFSIEATQDAALDGITVYTTGTEAAFAPVHKFGQAQGAGSVTGSYTMAKDGVYNFWIAYNVKSDAAVNSQASAKLTAFTINGTQTSVSEDITANISVTTGAHGIYTIGAGGDYPTIQAAVDAISAGVDGPVLLNIKSGEYNEKVSVPHILGASAVNTITLQSESGNRNDVKIYHNNYDNFGTGTDYQLRQYGVLTVSGCDWFTLRNVEVTTTDLSYPGLIVVKNESRHVTIDGCYLHAATTTNGQLDIDIINMTPIDEANRNNDFITVRNNLIEGGYIGIRLGGTSYVRLPKQVGGVVEGNTFKNNGTKSIYVMEDLGAKIRNNTVIVEANAETKISVGIFDMQLSNEHTESTEITGNIFNVAPKTYAPAINLRQIEGTANAPVIIANNVINMASLNASYSGLKFASAKSKHVTIAHNTIRMTGTNGGAAFWVSSKLDAGYGNINVVNNIIQNETSGYAVNLYADENLGKVNFQNNIIYTAGADLFRAATANKGNFDAFVTATGATACINKKVDFLSDNVLEPANNLSGDLLNAKALSYVSTDIVGKARPATGISIGAYEYTPDMVPTMLTGYPKVLTAIDGNASIAVRTDVAAKVYCIVRKSSEAAPTADELKASTIKIDVAADREATIGASGLEIGAEYTAYLLPVSLRGTDGTMSQTAAFVVAETPAPIAVPVADVYINNSTTEWTVAQGESVTLMAMVTVDERTAPYTLTWMDSKRNVLLTETYAQADDIDQIFTTTHTPTECTDYIFTVSDNAANTTTAFVRSIVTGEAITATFENIYLDPEGHWNAQTADGSDNAASFVSGSYKFPAWNRYGGTYWFGYALSNETATSYTDLKDQYRSAAGGGYNGSENYVVHFVSSWDEPQKIEVLNNAQGDIVSGFYVTNSAYAINSMTNGDGFAKKFEQGDWFKLTATADNGNTAEFYLADFRSANPDEHYMLTTWEWFDLSSLGQVRSISFSLTSSDVSAYGMNTPSYFCLDNFGGTRNERTISTQFMENGRLTLDMNTFKTLNEPGATTTYELVDNSLQGLDIDVQADGIVTVSGTMTDDFEFVIKITQRGKSEYIRIPVSVVTGVYINEVEGDGVEQRYSLDGRRVNKERKGVNIVKMKNGTTRKIVTR